MMSGIDTTSSTSGTSATTGSSTPSTQDSQDRFLKLLVAQLANQDPMNPLDNAQMTSQMAQISTVSAVEKVNTSIAALGTQLPALQMLQGSSLVGRDVLVPGETLALRDGKGQGAVELDLPADSVKVDVISAGRIVDTIDLGALAAGRTQFSWDAAKYPGVVSPTIQVTATTGGKAVTSTTYVADRVDSVSTGATGLQLQLSRLGAVAYSSVGGIL